MSEKILRLSKNVTLEELKKNPMLKNTSDETLDVLLNSALRAHNYVPEQDIPKKPNPLMLAKWYKKEIENYTRQIDEVEKECKKKCTCCAGCAACCKQLIGISSVEFLVIQTVIDSMSIEERQKLREKVGLQCDKLREAGITNELINKNVAEEEKIQEAYFKMGMVCPLLGENNLCMVYPVRPFNCWTYRNYGSPKECENNTFVDEAIKFDDWERVGLIRMMQARKPEGNIRILQYAIRDYLQ